MTDLMSVEEQEPSPVIEPARALRWLPALVLGAAWSWLAFLVAHRSLSGRVWWWNLPDLLPPLVFFVVPVLLLAPVLLVRSARRIGAVLLVGALALGWPCAGFNLGTLFHQPSPAPPGSVTVFSWNTWYWDERVTTRPDGGPIRDPDQFYQFLHRQKADVYLLQEHLYVDQRNWTPHPVTDGDRLRREFPGYHMAVSGELVTLSRFPIVADRPMDLRPYLDRQWPNLPPADSPLPAYPTVKTLRTDLLIGGSVVSFYNAHIYVPITTLPRHTGEAAWDGEARVELREANFRAVDADVDSNPHPILFAGDLNTSPAMRLLRTLPEKLVDASPALDSVYPASWARSGLTLWRLDWAFTTADVDVHQYQMVPPYDLSDHHGQLLVVSI